MVAEVLSLWRLVQVQALGVEGAGAELAADEAAAARADETPGRVDVVGRVELRLGALRRLVVLRAHDLRLGDLQEQRFRNTPNCRRQR